MISIKEVVLMSPGDARPEANKVCWPKQKETLDLVEQAFGEIGVTARIVNADNGNYDYGFVASQAAGAKLLAGIDPQAAVVLVHSGWSFAHHLSGPLKAHQGPILNLANFDGTHPGLVAMLNHYATQARLGMDNIQRLWTDGFSKDGVFMAKLGDWRDTGQITHQLPNIAAGASFKVSESAARLGEELARGIMRNKRILGQFDPGCMGMLNAAIDPGKLAKIGMPVEYLSQSDLLAEMATVSDAEAQCYLDWLIKQGAWFSMGMNPETHLTHAMLIEQMKMYAAGARIFARLGLAAFGVPYQMGLARCCAASDLPEGMWNNGDRPNVPDDDGNIIKPGEPLPHFNEGDLGSGVPQVLMKDIYRAKGLPAETTLHDVRFGAEYRDTWYWVLQISGGAPPAHYGGWDKAGVNVYRQPLMYFQKGGGTCSGVAKPGVITWARAHESHGELCLDCGLGLAAALPSEEVIRRRDATTKQWPIANVNIPGYGRDQLMGTHMSNHITVGYSDVLDELAATATGIGLPVRVIGDWQEVRAVD